MSFPGGGRPSGVGTADVAIRITASTSSLLGSGLVSDDAETGSMSFMGEDCGLGEDAGEAGVEVGFGAGLD